MCVAGAGVQYVKVFCVGKGVCAGSAMCVCPAGNGTGGRRGILQNQKNQKQNHAYMQAGKKGEERELGEKMQKWWDGVTCNSGAPTSAGRQVVQCAVCRRVQVQCRQKERTVQKGRKGMQKSWEHVGGRNV